MRVSFPVGLKMTADRPQLVGLSREPQQSISGAFTVVPTLSAYWTLSATFLVTNEATALAMQGFIACMEGMLGTTLVPMYQRWPARDRDGMKAPARLRAVLGDDSQVYGAGSETFEGFGFDNAPVVTAVLAEAAALRATRIKVASIDSTGLRPGQFFTIGERLYRVQLTWVDGGETVMQFQPPLRAAADVGAALVLDAPVCRMRFASEDEGVIAYDLSPLSTVALKFIEAI